MVQICKYALTIHDLKIISSFFFLVTQSVKLLFELLHSYTGQHLFTHIFLFTDQQNYVHKCECSLGFSPFLTSQLLMM